MMLIRVLFVLLFASTTHAASSSGDVSSLFGMLLNKRTFLTYGIGKVRDQESTRLHPVQKMQSYSFDGAIFFPLALRFGYSETFTQKATANFDGGADKRAEVYMTTFEWGLLANVPFGFISPYFGLGMLNGTISVSDPTNRDGNNDITAAFARERRSSWGHYWQAGIDWNIGSKIAIRTGAQGYYFDSRSFKNLQDEKMKLTYTKILIGAVGTY